MKERGDGHAVSVEYEEYPVGETLHLGPPYTTGDLRKHERILPKLRANSVNGAIAEATPLTLLASRRALHATFPGCSGMAAQVLRNGCPGPAGMAAQIRPESAAHTGDHCVACITTDLSDDTQRELRQQLLEHVRRDASAIMSQDEITPRR